MIKFNNIYLRYKDKSIFNNLSLEIKRGEKVVISGKSGLGKSSLFYLILGFVIPDSGNVFFNGVPINEKSIWNIRRQISFINQDVIIGKGKVSDWLKFVFSLKANTSLGFNNNNNKIKKLFNYFELDYGIIDKNIEILSGGERQRLAIITSILLEREVFLLDEPTSALDPPIKKRVVDFFCKRDDWTVVVISHDVIWLKNPRVKIYDMEMGKWKP